MQDTYMWLVSRADGTSLQEFDEARPDGRGWSEIGKDPIKDIFLTTSEGNRVHRVIVPAAATPVFFRRRTVAINPMSGQEEDRSTTHCIGWKYGENAAYLFVFEDGSVLLTNDLQVV